MITYSLAVFPKYSPANRKGVERTLTYVDTLKKFSCGRVAIKDPGRRMAVEDQSPALIANIGRITSYLRDLRIAPALYTGPWGGGDMKANPALEKWVQRDEEKKPLGYMGSLRSAMLCPLSPYVEEIFLPQLVRSVSESGFKTIFFDIPWIMKGGCHCQWCRSFREENGPSNSGVVRQAFEGLLCSLRRACPNVSLAVNASAPGCNFNTWTGGHIEALAGLFDEYVTEWNPYRWNQSATVVSRTIRQAKSFAEGTFSHASTVTDKKGRIYNEEELTVLFRHILTEGADPWLTVDFGHEGLSALHRAYLAASAAA